MIQAELKTLAIRGEHVFFGGILDEAIADILFAQSLQGMLSDTLIKADSPTRRLITFASQNGWPNDNRFINFLLPKAEFQVWWPKLQGGFRTTSKLVTMTEVNGLWEGEIIGFPRMLPHAVYVTQFTTQAQFESEGTEAKRLILSSFSVDGDSGEPAQYEPLVQQALDLHLRDGLK